MHNFLYRCPIVGLNVQGSIKRDKPADVGKDYHIVHCLACGGVHIVNPATGRLLRDETESESKA